MKKKPCIKDYFIGISFILFFLFEITRVYFYSDGNLSENMIFQEWILRLLRDISLAVFISSVIAFGVRDIYRKGLSPKRMITPFLGTLFALLIFFGNWMIESKLSDLGKGINYTKYLEKNKIALENPKLSLEEKERLSKMYASSYYRMYGRQIEYIKENHQTLYKPLKDEVEYVRQKAEQERFIHRLGKTKFLWLILIPFSFLLGLFLSKRREGKNEQ